MDERQQWYSQNGYRRPQLRAIRMGNNAGSGNVNDWLNNIPVKLVQDSSVQFNDYELTRNAGCDWFLFMTWGDGQVPLAASLSHFMQGDGNGDAGVVGRLIDSTPEKLRKLMRDNRFFADCGNVMVWIF